MSEKVVLKRGDTFLMECSVFLPDPVAKDKYGNPLLTQPDISDWEIASQVRNGDTLVVDLDVEIVIPSQVGEPANLFTLTCLDTRDWPINGSLVYDIQYTMPGGQVISSATMSIQCVKDVTL